jgi:hypothetical protein
MSQILHRLKIILACMHAWSYCSIILHIIFFRQILYIKRNSSLLRSLFAGPRFSPHVQAAYCSNTFHSNCLANHSLSTRIRNSSRKNLLIPKQRWRRMIKQHAAKSRNAHLPDAILNSAQWPGSQLWCHSINPFSSPEPFSLGHSLKIRLWFTRPNGKIWLASQRTR